MNVSPPDLRRHRFHSAFRGFDKVEVMAFLAGVADDYDRLRSDMKGMEAIVNEHREQEQALKASLIAAQKLAVEIKAQAEQEAQRIVHEAEGRCAQLLEKAQVQLDDVKQEIDALKLKRKEVEASIESTIQTLRQSLKGVRDPDSRDQAKRVPALTP